LELPQSFSHSSYSNPRAPILDLCQLLFRNAFTVVPNFDQYSVKVSADLDDGPFTAGVPMDVG
jgi:hypothetical protein